MADCGQHFKCVTKDAYTGLTSIIALGILSGALIIVDIVAAVFAGAAIPGVGVVAGVLFVVAIFELCAFLHGGKLVCLKDDVCTIGRIMEIEEVGHGKSGFEKMDDDFCINTLPCPHSPIESPGEIIASDGYQGPFIQEQAQSRDLGLGFSGYSVAFDDVKKVTGTDTEIFHVEVKGCRVHDVCGVLKALSFGAPVLGFICSIPLIGWIVCAVAAAIWLAVTAIAVGIAWAAAHVGDINDVYDPAAGELRPANATTGEGGDVILVRGDWVYDAGHDGWNEIQPIRHVQKLTGVIDPRYMAMGKADPSLVEEFKKNVLAVWCYYTAEAKDPLVIDQQKDPENSWRIHPDVDGCRKHEEPPPIK
jgi:hypothetical protein